MSGRPWLEVDREGLRLSHRGGATSAVFDLISNSIDAEATTVTLGFEMVDRGVAQLTCEDDAPGGFADLSHAYTMYAPSSRKGDATKRGRFNIGEKLVLAHCIEATIDSVTGRIDFHSATGRSDVQPSTRETGTLFTATAKFRKADVEAAVEALQRVIPPEAVDVFVNGDLIPQRAPVGTCEAKLPTELEDDEGFLRPTRRKTKVHLHQPIGDEKPTLYELGIPVVELPGGEPWHINVCVAPDTRILTADLRYVSADTVKVGDALVGFDEDRVGHRRRFRTSEVKNVEWVKRPSYRLTFDDGTVVVCSEDHQWLTAWSKTRRWLTTRQMIATAGNRPGTNVVRLFDVWGTDQSYTAGYLAAAFDGEGCLVQKRVTNRGTTDGVQNHLTFTQNANPMLERVKELLTAEGFAYRVEERPSTRLQVATTYNLHLLTRGDMVRFLGQYRPQRIIPKFEPELLGTITSGRSVRLLRKEYLGEVDVLAIETSTHTFVAEGLASHNCQKVPLNKDRDNVTPSFLREVRVAVLNATHQTLTQEQAASTWARDAMPKATDAAVESVVTARFGDKRVIHDMGDPEASGEAASQGYTVVHGGSMSREEWDAVKRTGVILPAPKVTPAHRPQHTPDGDDTVIPPSQWSDGMKRVVAYTERFGRAVLAEITPIVKVVKDPGNATMAAWYSRGPAELTYNVACLGNRWFDEPTQEAVDRLLIHEFAHHTVSDHFSHEFHEACCAIGAARIAAKGLRGL